MFFPDKQFFVSAVYANRTKRCGDQDRQNCNRKYDLSAGKSHGEWYVTDRCLNGCFWKIGDHAEKSFFEVQRSFCHAQADTDGTENKCQKDQDHGSDSGMHGITDVYGGTDQNKQQDFSGDPEFAKLQRQPSGDITGAF